MAQRTSLVDRRAILERGAALMAATVIGPGVAFGQTAAQAIRFRTVAADTHPLAAIGGGASARLIQQLLPGKLTEVFADLLGGDARAPTLIARIDRISLSAFADLPSPGLDRSSGMDSLEGAGLVVSGRQVLSTTPLRVTLPPGYSGTYYLPDIDQRRIDSLCYQFAWWLKREMNL